MLRQQLPPRVGGHQPGHTCQTHPRARTYGRPAGATDRKGRLPPRGHRRVPRRAGSDIRWLWTPARPVASSHGGRGPGWVGKGTKLCRLPLAGLTDIGVCVPLVRAGSWADAVRVLVWGACDPNGHPARQGNSMGPTARPGDEGKGCRPTGGLVQQSARMTRSAGEGWPDTKRTSRPAARLPAAVTFCAGRACTRPGEARPRLGHFWSWHPRAKRRRHTGAMMCQAPRRTSGTVSRGPGTRFPHGTARQRKPHAQGWTGGPRPPKTSFADAQGCLAGIPPTGVFRWELWFQRLFYYTGAQTTTRTSEHYRPGRRAALFTNVNGLFTELRT